MPRSNIHDLIQRLEALLEPGDIDLAGVIVQSGLSDDQEIELYELTLTVGDIVADATGVEDWYVYAGNDDSRFASNQYQGLAIEDDGFVWECQHLLRSGEFDLVLYYGADVHPDVVAGIEQAGMAVTPVPSPDSESLSGGIDDDST